MHSGWYFSTVQLPISHTKTGALRPLELAGRRVAPNFVAFNRVAFWRYANKIKTGWLNIYMLYIYFVQVTYMISYLLVISHPTLYPGGPYPSAL